MPPRPLCRSVRDCQEPPSPGLTAAENNPEVMTRLVRRLGLSPAYGFADVFSIDDPELLAFVPRPAHALLLVFPISAAYEANRTAEDASYTDPTRPSTTDSIATAKAPPVTWFPQTIPNACGLIGLLHAASNGVARHALTPGSPLATLLQQADATPDPKQRADLVARSDALADAHADAAGTGDSAAPSAEADVDLHFVCFVRMEDDDGGDGGSGQGKGTLWELDGRRAGPLRRASLAPGEDVLSSPALAAGARRFVEREAAAGGDLRFSLVSLGPSLE